MKKFQNIFAAAAVTLIAAPVAAEIKVGVITAATGPGASLGVLHRNMFMALPSTLGGEPVAYIILDDASDSSAATRAARRLATEEKVDLIVGSGNVPTASAISYVASETNTPQIALSPLVGAPAKNPWVYSISLPAALQIGAIIDHAVLKGFKNIAYVGFSDGWGDQVHSALIEHAAKAGINVTNNERYARLDTSVGSQVLKIIAAKPDAVIVGASGTPAALPHITLVDRGFKGQVYHTAAVINPDFLRIGGKSLEGALIAGGPSTVAEQLPTGNPMKAPGLRFKVAYEAKHGPGTSNSVSAYSWDAYLIADRAVALARKKAKPGTLEFRQALRDYLEQTKEFAGAQGVYSMSGSDHAGSDKRAVLMLRVRNGTWTLND